MQRWGRNYYTARIFVKQDTVNVLLALNNGDPVYQSVFYDKKFIKTLMQDIFGGQQLTADSHLDPSKIKFMEGKMK